MEISEIGRISVLLFVVLIFLIFIVLDAFKAYTRQAHWVPSHFLVLSALIIQLLNLLSGKSALSEDAWEGNKLKKSALWMIHSGRLMLCVVMGYLLPSMAARGSKEFWGKIAALGIAILGQMTTELYTVNSYAGGSLTTLLSLWPNNKGSNELLFIGSAVLLSFSFTLLILLLGCANIASGGIQVIFAQKIPLILKEGKDESKEWHDVENEVLKAWIVARAYTPEYIIARSPLSSSAASVLSVLIWTSIIGWLHEGPSITTDTVSDKMKLLVIILQVTFILIGWAIIGWRCAIAAGYYTRWHKGTRRSVCRVEDYWTRYILELIDERRPKLLQAQRLKRNVGKLIAKPPTKYHAHRTLLYVLMGLQWGIVLFSKICWLVPLVIFHNKFTDKLVALILSKHDESKFEKFENYEVMLKELVMLGETAESLWIANKKSIRKAKESITQGHLDGKKSCTQLVDFLLEFRNKNNETPDGIDLSVFHKKRPQEFSYLWRNENYEPLGVEKQFKEASNISWKMTAVCLIRFIIHLYPISNYRKEVKDYLKVYAEAWEILDFVDGLEADGIMCEAADKFFLTIQKKVEEKDLPPTPWRIDEAINGIATEAKEKASKPRGFNIWSAMIRCLGLEAKLEKGKPDQAKTETLRAEKRGPQNKEEEEEGKREKQKDVDEEFEGAYDSMNWKNVAAGIALYKLCKSIAPNPDPTKSLEYLRKVLEELHCALADIVYGSMIKARTQLASNSRKWAIESDENSIGRALYVAGKAKALMRMDRRGRETSEKTLTTVANQLQYFPSGSEEPEINPPAEHRLEILPSTI